MLEWLEDVVISVPDDEVFASIADLKSDLHEAVPPEGTRLREVKSYTPGATMPAIVIAHHIYGDASRADDIVARNKVVHPGAVPGGVPLEVIV